METEWAHTKQVPSTCHYCLGKSCQPRSMTHSGPNQGYPTNCSKLSNRECVLRKASVQTKNCPRKRRNDAVSWWVKQVQDSGGIRGTFPQRGEKAQRKTGCFWIEALEWILLSRQASVCRSEHESMNSPAEPDQRPAAQHVTGFGELILAKSLEGYSNRDAHWQTHVQFLETK